jgi:hypothetical protein
LGDQIGSLLNFKSATTSQGSFSFVGGVVIFNLGTIPAGGTVAATVTVQAAEDGGCTSEATVGSNTPDPNPANNSAGVASTIAEPIISSSTFFRIKAQSIKNATVGEFTHANGVESPSSFVAVIRWGDGTASLGTITELNNIYYVSGSHVYPSNSVWTISVLVSEPTLAAQQLGNQSPGQAPLRSQHTQGHIVQGSLLLAPPTGNSTTVAGSASISAPASVLLNTTVLDQLFTIGGPQLETLLLQRRHPGSATDWFVDFGD